MEYSKFYREFRGKYKKAEFTNKHGEKFYLLKMLDPRAPDTILLTGSELDWKVKLLFNQSFDILTEEEIEAIGHALIELATNRKEVLTQR